MADRGSASPSIRFARGITRPRAQLTHRLLIAVCLVLFIAVGTYLDRSGYRDVAPGEMTPLDALYYATVSITTVGYGDITPVSPFARFFTTFFATPARILFLILLVGTTVELLTSRAIVDARAKRWRKRLRDHIIVCGYGTEGRTAARVLVEDGVPRAQIVVVDRDERIVEEASVEGFTALQGEAARSRVLEQVEIAAAATVIVCTGDDDSSTLVTLTARELNPTATIVASVREEENAHLLRQSGATSVVLSAAAAGRLLGLSVRAPKAIKVLEDLMAIGGGLDLIEREVEPDEIGATGRPRTDSPLVAVLRGDEKLHFDAPGVLPLRDGDRLVCLRAART